MPERRDRGQPADRPPQPPRRPSLRSRSRPAGARHRGRRWPRARSGRERSPAGACDVEQPASLSSRAAQPAHSIRIRRGRPTGSAGGSTAGSRLRRRITDAAASIAWSALDAGPLACDTGSCSPVVCHVDLSSAAPTAARPRPAQTDGAGPLYSASRRAEPSGTACSTRTRLEVRRCTTCARSVIAAVLRLRVSPRLACWSASDVGR